MFLIRFWSVSVHDYPEMPYSIFDNFRLFPYIPKIGSIEFKYWFLRTQSNHLEGKVSYLYIPLYIKIINPLVLVSSHKCFVMELTLLLLKLTELFSFLVFKFFAYIFVLFLEFLLSTIAEAVFRAHQAYR